MKNTIITKRSFLRRRMVGLLLFITAVILVACEDADIGTMIGKEDSRTSVEGTLSYRSITTNVGKEAVSILETIDELEGQEVEYTITRTDGGTVLDGILIDSVTGTITVADTATRSNLDTYTVSMTGTGVYHGTIETTVGIWVKAFDYGQMKINASSGGTLTQPLPKELGLSASSFALKEETQGLSIDADSGTLTIDPDSISAGTHIIVVTEGAETYEVEFSVEDRRLGNFESEEEEPLEDAEDGRSEITGTVSYADITTDVGVSHIESPVWSGETEAGQEVEYAIARTDGGALNGVSIDVFSGEIIVSNTAEGSTSENMYTVSATGTGAYKGTIETTVAIWVKIWVQAFSAYDTVTITDGSIVTQYPPSGLPLSFVLKEKTNGLSVDANSGKVTIDPTLLSTGVYLITVTEGTETYEVGIEIILPKPANKAALVRLVNSAISSKGNNVNLNYIDTSSVTDMNSLFKDKADFNGNISEWDVSKVADMRAMFNYASAFNGDISKWDVSNVISMNYMFSYASAFNGDVSDWDVSNVTSMGVMFYKASAFNGDVSDWDVSNVISMRYTFGYASAFNQDVSRWNVSNVKYMTAMFNYASAFNGDISKWDVSKVNDMEAMFFGASKFNQDLSEWNVSKVTNMYNMFHAASAFNQDLSEWSVGKVTLMTYMFSQASSFNQDISKWDVSRVNSMREMFYNASAFNQNLEDWDVKASAAKTNMFRNSGVASANLPSWY